MRGLAAIPSAIVVAVVTTGLTGSLAAAPLSPGTVAVSKQEAVSKQVTAATPVRWRGRGGGAAVAAGVMSGWIVGGMVAAPHYYYEPYPYYPYPYYFPGYYAPQYVGPIGYGASGWEDYCLSRYRSFDPISGTYVGYDGRRHNCR